MEINFVPFDEQFLQHSSKWLQDEEIRMLIHASPFSAEQQQQWFEQLPARKNYLIWGVECDHQPVGVTGLKNVTTTDAEYWGYIGEKEYWGKGIGKQMMQFIEDEASRLKLNNIYLHVSVTNQRAIASYTKSGFSILSTKDDLLMMGKSVEQKNGEEKS
jgi:RimJ/RimL family protein N-acetyltransferase